MTKLFRSNRSQAVRLPKGAEFPADVVDVEVVVEGNTRRLIPKKKGKDWAAYFAERTLITDDFVVRDDDLAPADDISLDD